MFTGLVQAVGTVTRAARLPNGILQLSVAAPDWAHRPARGDSIAVNGCCLTVANDPALGGGEMAFEAVPQTLALTTLSSVQPGERVNLEHAALATTYLGGHIVQGHVDGVGRVNAVQQGSDWRVSVEVPEGLELYMLPRGSVCLSGVSLTLADVRENGRLITVALIPTTLEMTNLAKLKVGQGVNIEADAMTKAVVATVMRVMESWK